MRSFLGAVLVAFVISGVNGRVRADEKDAKAIIDKAIKALGGDEKLTKANPLSWKSKGTITFNGNDNEFTGHRIAEGLDHWRSEFEGRFGDNDVKGVTVVNGDKGWRKFGDMDHDLEEAELANEKRTIYLEIIPTTLVHLRGKGFKTAHVPHIRP